MDSLAVNISQTGQSITPDTDDSVIDLCVQSYFDGMAKGDSPITVSPDYTKKIDGDAVVVTSQMEFTLNDVRYSGLIYLGFLGTQTCSVMASVPESADEQYKKTIDAIIDNVQFVKAGDAKQEKTPSKSQADETESQSTSKPTATVSQQNARSKALDYLDYTAFSYTGLIEQLEYEGFSTEDATYGADNCGADWNKQAAKKAQDYLDYTSFSRDGLIDQLVYEGFTYDQAVYGVDSVGL